MVQIDNTYLFVLLLVVVAALGLSTGALLALHESGKQKNDGTPLGVVLGILEYADTVAKMGLAIAATTETQVDDELAISWLEARGFEVTGNSDTGYHVKKAVKEVPPIEETS
jgi:hypothetical protein